MKAPYSCRVHHADTALDQTVKIHKMASSLSFIACLCLASGLWISAVASDGCKKTCASGWWQFGDRCYLYLADGKQWPESELECIKYGANLVSLHSQEEYEFIKKAIKDKTGSDTRIWTGGFDMAKEGSWMWTDGSKWDFTIWGPGEPTNGQDVEHCMELNYFGKANDGGCQNVKPFICAKYL